MSFTKNYIYDLLNAKNIQFTCTEHRPVYSMEELDALEMPADALICKNLFLRNSNGKQHFLLTIPAATPVDLSQRACSKACKLPPQLRFGRASGKISQTAVRLSFPLRPIERYKQKRYLRQQQKLTAIRHHRYSSER